MTGYEDTKKLYKFLKYANPEPGEKVIIFGFAGRFPESQNMKELKNNIFNCKSCITENERHWKLGNSEIPKHFGRIQNIEKFDASFFGIHFNQAHMMDPMSKMMLEHAYEAIIDAGINPEDIRGTRTGVFVNSCFSDSEPILLHSKLQTTESKVDMYVVVSGHIMMLENMKIAMAINNELFVITDGFKKNLIKEDL